MPELPEVECTVRYLAERIVGAVIQSVDIRWNRSIALPSADEFSLSIAGSKITRVERRGKYIVCSLQCRSKEFFLFVHLRMSGQLNVVPHGLMPDPYDRVALSLSNGHSLCFHDVRKFGKMYFVSDPNHVVGSLGIEPLSSDFTPEWLQRALKNRRRFLKPFLLDQSVIAGIGNIYADESLFRARLHPLTVTDKCTKEQTVLLHESIQTILLQAIAAAGTDSGDNVVHGGMYSPLVYGRAKAPCSVCKAVIKRTVVAQRGTHFCPRCQRRNSRQIKEK